MGEQNKERGPVKCKGYWQSPQQIYDALRTTWRKYEREKFDLEAFEREIPISYFRNEINIDDTSEYDRAFHCVYEFDPKKKREDRQNADIIRNRIFTEERGRIFPVLSSHIYGHRESNLEGKSWLCHKKVNVMSETRRRWCVNLKPTKKLPTVDKIESL